MSNCELERNSSEDRDDMTQLLNMVREMVMAVARLEKRLVEAKIATEAFELEHALPPPPPPLCPPKEFSHIPTTSPVIRVYEMRAARMPVGMPLPKLTGNGKIETARPRQFVVSESSGSEGLEHHRRESWYVDHFRKWWIVVLQEY